MLFLVFNNKIYNPLNSAFLKYLIHEEIFVLKSEFSVAPPKPSMPIAIASGADPKTEKQVWSKPLLLITDDFRGNKIPSVERELLLKILKTININPLDDVDVISIHHFEKTRIGYPQHILILVTDSIASFAFTKYQSATWRDIPVISADSLREMIKDVSLKRKLWNELQRVFHI